MRERCCRQQGTYSWQRYLLHDFAMRPSIGFSWLPTIVFTVGIWLCLLWVNYGDAHPPGNHRPVTKANAANAMADNNRVVGETDRQVAYFQFEFLSSFVYHCPTEDQSAIIAQALEELRVATQSPQAIALNELVKRRATIHDSICSSTTVKKLRWGEEGIEAEDDVNTIEVARGLSRCCVLEIENATKAVLNITVRVQGQKQNEVPWTLLPGKSQFFLTTLYSTASPIRIDLEAGGVMRTILQPVETVEPAKVRGRLIDGDRDMPTAARVRVEGSDHQYRHAGPFALNRSFTEKPLLLFSVPRAYRVPFFYADGTFEIDVPPGATRVTMERGFEHPILFRDIDLKPGEVVDVTLKSERFVDMKSKGWISGDTHIHWVTNTWNVDLPIEDLAWVQRAEDIRVANNLTLLHRTNIDAFIKPSQGPMGPIKRLSDADYHIEMAEEYRNQNLYGHLCFLNLKWLVMPIGTGPQIAGDDSLDYPINKPAILQAREQGAISIEAHGIGANHELPLNAIHALTDSLDQIDPDDYYRLLDCGFQLPLTNGSDHPARIAGCARAYVRVDGDFSYEKWIDGVRRGRTFTTSGPLLNLTVNGNGVGDVLTPARGETIHVTVSAQSRYPLGRVQLVSNGEILREVETEETQVNFDVDLPADESRWFVARCSRSSQWNAIWEPDIAHTSAVYVNFDHRPVFREAAAREWINRMQVHIRDIQTKGRFGNDTQRSEAVAYVNDSIWRYESLISQLAKASVDSDQSNSAKQKSRAERLLLLLPFVSKWAHESSLVEAVRNSEDVADLSRAVEPFVIVRADVDDGNKIRLSPGSIPQDLVFDRTYRFLVEVHNSNRLPSDRFTMEFDAKALQRVLESVMTDSQLDVSLVENHLSNALISGEEVEWKLIEVRKVR